MYYVACLSASVFLIVIERLMHTYYISRSEDSRENAAGGGVLYPSLQSSQHVVSTGPSADLNQLQTRRGSSHDSHRGKLLPSSATPEEGPQGNADDSSGVSAQLNRSTV